MSAQALSQVTLRRTRLLYIPIKKTMIRTSAIKITQPTIGKPLAGRNTCKQPLGPIYVSASMTVKNRSGLLCATDTPAGLIPLAYSSALVYAALCVSPASLSYALQDAQRFRLWHRRLPGRGGGRRR